MKIATLTSKGQVTIPIEIREALGVDTGDRLAFEPAGDGVMVRTVRTASVSALRGMFGKAKKTVTIEEMNATIRRRGAGGDK